MDDDIRAAFDQVLQEMRRGFAEIDQRLAGVDQRFDRVDQRFAGVDQRFDRVDQRLAGVDQRFDRVDQRLDRVDQRLAGVDQRFDAVLLRIRENGVLIEDLRVQLQQVAEGEQTNARAIERLRAEMTERFRENEIIVGGAFRQIRRDIDELRERH